MLIDKDKFIISILLTIFWVWCTFGFISEEIAPFLLSVKSGIFFLIDVIIFLIGLLVLKNKWDKIFVWFFLALSFWTTCIYNGYDIIFYFNGLRDFLYLISLVPIFRYIYNSSQREEFVKNFDKHLFVFLIIQAICITFQFVKYGANDHGGGSMGNGFSGIVSILIFLISFYLLKKRMNPESYWLTILNNKWLIVLLFPTLLNETKISFILIALYFVLLLPLTRKSIIKLVFLFPIMCVGLYIMFNVYMSTTDSQFDITSRDFLETYLYAAEDDDIVEWVSVLQEHGEDFAIDGTHDIPRFTKYMMIPELNRYYPGHTITGYGLGHFKGGTMIGNSKFYMDNEWLLRGSIPYGYHAYIQLGFFSIFYFIWLWFRFISLRLDVKANKEIVIYIMIITFFILLYNDFFRGVVMSIPFFYIFTQAFRWQPIQETTSLEKN